MTCPYLKEVRMVFCRAYPVKKLVPLDQLVSASCCATECAFQGCAAYLDARARVELAADEGELVDELTSSDPPGGPTTVRGSAASDRSRPTTTQDPDHPGKGPTP